MRARGQVVRTGKATPYILVSCLSLVIAAPIQANSKQNLSHHATQSTASVQWFQAQTSEPPGSAVVAPQRRAEADRLLQQGIEQFKQDQFEQSLKLGQQALEIYQTIDFRMGEGNALRLIGTAYFWLENYDQAIAAYGNSLKIAQELSDLSSQSLLLQNLGDSYFWKEEYKTAISFYEKSLVLVRSLKNHPSEMSILRGLGDSYYWLKEHAKAIDYYLQSLEIARSLNDRKSETRLLSSLSNSYYWLENYATAIEYLQQGLTLARSLNDRKSEALLLSSLGNNYYWLEDYAKSIEAHQQSLTLARSLNDRASEALALSSLGNNYQALENYVTAIDYFLQSLQINRELKDRSSEALVLSSLGNSYIWLKDYPKAIDYYLESLKINRELKNRNSEGLILSQLGQAYYALEAYGKAIEYQQQSLNILQDARGKGVALQHLGLSYYQLGDYSQAIRFYEQSLAIARELKNQKREGQLLINLGNAYFWLGKYDQAQKFFEASLPILKANPDQELEVTSLIPLGDIYYQQGKFDQARDLYQRGLTSARLLKNRWNEGVILVNLGKLAFKDRDLTSATRYFQQGLAIAREFKYAWNEAAALRWLAQTAFSQKQYSEAESYMRTAIQILEPLRLNLNDSQKVSINETQKDYYKDLERILIAQNQIAAALETSERGRARAFVDLLSSRLSAQANEVSQPIVVPAISTQEIQQVARNQKATLVNYSILDNVQQGKPELYIWVVKPTGEIHFRSVALESFNQKSLTLQELVATSRASLGVRGLAFQENEDLIAAVDQSSTSMNQKLQHLHQLLIDPIVDLLPTHPDDRVIFIPQGSLFLVPFPALQDRQGQPLIEKHTMLTAPSIQVLQLTRQQRNQGLRRQRSGKDGSPSHNILIVGNPAMPKYGNPPTQLSALPGAEQEAQKIADLFKVPALIGQKATEALVVQQMPQARLIHLATHGLFDDAQGLGSAVALTPTPGQDGLLKAEEILNLTLRAELVVLSACDTGRGRITGDGVIGLSRSLISAGVPSVIVSLWAVPDAPTAELMTRFYQNLEKGQNKAQALRLAMLDTKKNFPDPRSWAAFTLIGEAE